MRQDLARRADWEARLAAYLEKARGQPHKYGKHDCILHAANAVRALTGRDLAKGHRGKYRGRVSARRYLEKLGHRSVEAMLDALLPEREVAFARRGDLVMDADGVPGVCLGGSAAFVGALNEDGRVTEGLVTQPRAAWVKAWAVG
jgi:hypothetical protein